MPGDDARGLAELAAATGDLLVSLEAPPGAEITGLAYDSRRVAAGDLFFCLPGRVTDGHLHAASAVARGAAALCVERPTGAGVGEIVVSDSRRAMGRIAAKFHGNPAERLLVLGVTGTNGKTTTAWLVDSILQADGRKSGLIGTIETRIAGAARPGVRTTPESIDLQRIFAEMVAAGCDSVAMEVTSHGLALDRVEGTRFDAAAFTNLTQDHLDFHDSMEDYFEAKAKLFTPGRTERGVVNVDEPYGRRLKQQARVPCVGYGTGADAEIRGTDIAMTTTGSRFTIATPKGSIEVTTALVGSFNVSNCLAAAAVALQAGIGLDAIEAGIARLRAVPGRFEPVDSGQPFSVVVDYAHTPDSLDNVLRAARNVADRGGGRVVVVFGCGGDRDRAKRPLMGAVAATLADTVVVTSDNPRSEDPRAIVDEILEGVFGTRRQAPDAVLLDRAEAIGHAIGAARAGDVVVIAGKGHETGQEFADRTVPFDDRAVALQALAKHGWERSS